MGSFDFKQSINGRLQNILHSLSVTARASIARDILLHLFPIYLTEERFARSLQLVCSELSFGESICGTWQFLARQKPGAVQASSMFANLQMRQPLIS